MTDDNDDKWETVDISDQPHDHVTVGFRVHLPGLPTQDEEDIIKEAAGLLIASFTDPDCPEEIKDAVDYAILQREYCSGHDKPPTTPDILKLIEGLISKKKKEDK